MAESALRRFKQKFLPRTLFARSLMILAVPIVLLQVLVAFFFFDRHWQDMSEKLVKALAGEVNMIASRVEDARTQGDIDKIVREARKGLDLDVSIAEGGTKISQPELSFEKFSWFNIAQKLHGSLEKRLDRPFTLRPNEKSKWFEIIVVTKNGKALHILCPDSRLYTPTTYIFLLWIFGSAVLLLTIAMIFMRNQVRPIMRLAVAAEKFGKGQDVPDFRPVGAREVRQASSAFLEMRDRLKRQIEQRTAMLSGVSHDLRTPITRMKLQLAMSSGDGAENLRQDVEEMERMIEGYLTFAKGESNETPEMTDLRSILDRVIAKVKRQGVNVSESLPDDRLMLRLRPLAIERAIANIVSNAAKYAQNVWVSAYSQSEAVEITVDDDGPGIAENMREEVFRPFFRVEKSRNKKTGGVGLGLSIAQDIVHVHGGEIFLEDSNRGGLRVVIRLPM